MVLDRKFWWAALLLFVLVMITGIKVPMVVNAAKYAEVSREMVESGDWINLKVGGDAYDQKPPLMFWIGALFFSLFGVSTIVFKISILPFSFLGIYSTYRLGKLLYGKSIGQLAALFWASSLAFLHFHDDIHTDTLLASVVVFAVWQLAAFFEERKSRQFILGIVGVGLAMLTKGPVGLVIPACAVGAQLLLHRRWRDIFHLRWIVAALLTALLISPALIGLYNQFGPEGIKFYFWTNNVGRITGSYAGSGNDPAFYLHTSLYMLAPFTAFAIAGIAREIRKYVLHKGKVESDDEFYSLGGTIPYLLVLSFAQAQNPHYMMAVIPFVMILAARFVVQLQAGEVSPPLSRVIQETNRVISILLWLLIFIFTLYIFPEKDSWFWITLTLLTAIFVYFRFQLKGMERQIGLLTLTMFAFIFTLQVSIIPHQQAYHSSFRAVDDYNRRMTDSEQLHIYRPQARYWELFFYGKKPGKYFVTEKDLPRLLEEQGDWVYTDAKGKEEITREIPETQVVGEYSHRNISSQSLKFLNPKTRASKLEKRYLLKLPQQILRYHLQKRK